MSSALALAATSRVMAAVIDDAVAVARLALPGILGAATTTSSPPDKIDTTIDGEITNLNLFLYHVSYNQGWREAGLPTRNGSGASIGRAPLALDLHYLLSAYSAEDYPAQIMLGIGMQALHEIPVLFRQKIQDVFTGAATDIDKALATSNLANQIELMKITPQQLTTDELAKLWTAFPGKLRVSAGYAVSVALIETEAPFTAPLPVLTPRITVFPFLEPSIVTVVPQMVPYAAGATISIQGSNLPGQNTVVIFDGSPTAPQTPSVVGNGASVTVALPPLLAGLNTLYVARELDLGEPALTPVVESNTASFTLQPVIQRGAASPYPYQIDVGVADPATGLVPVTVQVSPALAPTQAVSLLLTQMNVAPPATALSYMFDADPTGITLPGTVVFQTSGIASGYQYLVRVRVDGADSPLDIDPVTKQFVTPSAAF